MVRQLLVRPVVIGALLASVFLVATDSAEAQFRIGIGSGSGTGDPRTGRSGVEFRVGPGGVEMREGRTVPPGTIVPGTTPGTRRTTRSDLLRDLLIPESDPYYGRYDGYRYGDSYDPRYRDNRVIVPDSGLVPSVAPPSTQAVPPTSAQVAMLPGMRLRALLREALYGLDEELNAMSTGAAWKRHLHVSSLTGLLADDQPDPPSAATRDRLRFIADQYDTVAADPNYRSIQVLWGFATLRVGVREYSRSPLERGQGFVRSGVELLNRQLDGLSTGAGWKQHLATDEVATLARARQYGQGEFDRLMAIRQKYDDTGRNTQYETITRLSGFRATQRGLAELLATLALPPEAAPLNSVSPPPPPAP